MNKIVNLQMSFFGDYSDIKPKAEVLVKLVKALDSDEFIPGSVDITNIDPITGKFILDSRIQMTSGDKVWTIVFLPNRIDFNYNYLDGTEEYKHIDSIIKHGENFIVKVFNEFDNLRGNRLALNCRLLNENLSNDKRMEFFARFAKPLEVYHSDIFEEWAVRFNSRANIETSELKEENCNRVVEITQLERLDQSSSYSEPIYDIALTVDVNTDATNPSFRFESKNLTYFVHHASSFVEDVINEVKEV